MPEVLVVCHPATESNAMHLLREDWGYDDVAIAPDPGMRQHVCVIWRGDRPRVATVPRHALRSPTAPPT